MKASELNWLKARKSKNEHTMCKLSGSNKTQEDKLAKIEGKLIS